ncbi:MAG TPA: hypothetical protein VFB32_11180 [Rudaea sp.]|nr:hypothetical protein [Rudaea sp.]
MDKKDIRRISHARNIKLLQDLPRRHTVPQPEQSIANLLKPPHNSQFGGAIDAVVDYLPLSWRNRSAFATGNSALAVALEKYFPAEECAHE